MNTRLPILSRRRWLPLLIALPSPLLAQDPAISPSVSPDSRGLETPSAAVASSPIAAPANQPNESEMMQQMMELSKLNDNHKLLGQLAGSWSYTVTMWMAPDAPPMKSTGSATTRPIMNGRYFVSDVSGKIKMPGSDGKLKDADFKGMAVEGYDNVKKKFVSAWIDNMGTGIMMSEGNYDEASKTFTYESEEEMMPGTKTKVREVIKIADKDHHTMEWYEDRGGQQVKTMQIDYTRKR